MRTVKGLIWAKPLEKRPAKLPKARAKRGAKAAGLRYERALAEALPLAKHGQWFEFEDLSGLGWCQTDLLLQTPFGIAVLEAKYTWVEEGHRQVEGLYLPILERCYPSQPVFGLVVCKVLTLATPRQMICRELSSALYRAASGLSTIFHWPGAALGPLALPVAPSPLAPARCAG